MEETAEAPDFLILRLQIFCKLLHGLGINDTVILCVNDEDGAGKGGFRDRRPLDCREHAAEEADRDLAMDERIVVVFGAFFFVVRQVGGLDAVRKMQLLEQGRKAEVENGLQDRGRIEDAHGGRRKHKARELGRVRIAKAEEIINGDQSAQAMREEKERALLTQLAIGLEPGHPAFEIAVKLVEIDDMAAEAFGAAVTAPIHQVHIASRATEPGGEFLIAAAMLAHAMEHEHVGARAFADMAAAVNADAVAGDKDHGKVLRLIRCTFQ